MVGTVRTILVVTGLNVTLGDASNQLDLRLSTNKMADGKLSITLAPSTSVAFVFMGLSMCGFSWNEADMLLWPVPTRFNYGVLTSSSSLSYSDSINMIARDYNTFFGMSSIWI